MVIEQIIDVHKKQQIVRKILEALPDWFAIPEGREEYINDSVGQICIAALEDEQPIGFICLKETGKDTMELAVMGVLQTHHRQGIGRNLFLGQKILRKKITILFYK